MEIKEPYLSVDRAGRLIYVIANTVGQNSYYEMLGFKEDTSLKLALLYKDTDNKKTDE